MKYNTINEYFSKIYCINLDRRPERYNQCIQEFRKINANVERASGIDGNTIQKPNLKINPYALGLILTHKNLIENAISKQYDNILFLEDDVLFIDNFNKIFNEKIEYLPKDWDILYLGGNHILQSGKFTLITGDKNFNVTQNNYKTLNNELCKTTITYTTHAIAINSKFYHNVIDLINQNNELPIDNIYVKSQQDGTCNAYTFLPSIVLQRAGYSDIENQYVDYTNMIACNF